MKKISFIFICTLLVLGCKGQREDSFGLKKSASKAIGKNAICLNVFNQAFGIDKAIIQEQKFFENFLDEIVERNENTLYEKFLYMNLIERREITIFSIFSIGIMPNGDGIITKYPSEKSDLNKLDTKKIKKFDLASFYEKLGDEATESDRLNTSLLVIEFENNENCNCKLYSIPFTEGSNLKNFSFFN